MSEKAEKAVEKIEKSVNKENFENGDDEGTFDYDSFGENIKFWILYTQTNHRNVSPGKFSSKMEILTLLGIVIKFALLISFRVQRLY